MSAQWQLLFSKIEEWIKPMNRLDLEKALEYRRALSLIGRGLNITFSNKPMKEQYQELSNLLYSEEYRCAIRQLPLKYFPIHWKLFYGMAKLQTVFGVLFLLKIMKTYLSK